MNPPDPYTHGPTCRVFLLTNDEDMRTLVTSGLIFRAGGPKSQRAALGWLMGHPEVPLHNLPANIADVVTKWRAQS